MRSRMPSQLWQADNRYTLKPGPLIADRPSATGTHHPRVRTYPFYFL